MLINYGETTQVDGHSVEVQSITGTRVTLLVDGASVTGVLGEDITVGDASYTITMLWSPATFADGSRGDGHSFSVVIVPSQSRLSS